MPQFPEVRIDMYLQFALVALLTLTGIISPAPRVPDLVGARDSSPTSTARAVAADAVADGVSLKEIDIVVPPVEQAVALVPPEAPLESQAAPDAVVADQLVTPERVESEVVEAAGFQTLGVTWPSGAEVSDLGGQVRIRTDGEWSEWTTLQPGDGAPDSGTADAGNALRGGTEPLSIGDAEAVQLAFSATPDGGPEGLSLALVGSAERAAPDRVVGASGTGEATIRTAAFSTGALRAATAPRIISRAEWGAPAQICAPDVAEKLVGAVVHHTAGSNSYSTVAQAMQQIRNDAAYHISGRGWCDIGYNFIVDKWGNIYEGRANSMTQAVIGVHDGGFNTGTVGVSMLGTYDAVPSVATQQAVGQLIGWRLGAYGIDPLGSMTYWTGAGENSKYVNQNVSLPRIFGHRDTAYTACPGNGGYAVLPNIRAAAAVTAKTVLGGPIGQFESISSAAGQVTASGWAIDPDTSAPIMVQMYLDGLTNALSWAGLPRPDVAAVYPSAGANHGYRMSMAASPGVHSVCLYAINTGPGTSTALGCRTVTVALSNPIGQIDWASTTTGSATASGWAIDPDTASPILVQMYLDGRTNAVAVAGKARSDIGAAFPAAGPNHGFSITMATTPGVHSLCLYAINIGPGTSTPLGCRTVTVASPEPFGQIDAVAVAPGTVRASGWAIDADTTGPILVQMYLDGRSYALTWANQSRPDVGNAYPTAGPDHGFSLTMAAERGVHSACLYAINTGPGTSTSLGCRTVTVP